MGIYKINKEKYKSDNLYEIHVVFDEEDYITLNELDVDIFSDNENNKSVTIHLTPDANSHPHGQRAKIKQINGSAASRNKICFPIKNGKASYDPSLAKGINKGKAMKLLKMIQPFIDFASEEIRMFSGFTDISGNYIHGDMKYAKEIEKKENKYNKRIRDKRKEMRHD